MKNSRYIYMILFVTFVCVAFCFGQKVLAAEGINRLESPENIKVFRETQTSLKLKWSQVDEADGYIVYRYNKQSKKYEKVNEIHKSTTTQWINKKLESNKIYKYKVAAYKTIDGKQVVGDQSIWVKAKTYKKDSKNVNGDAPKVSDKNVYLGLCSSGTIETYIKPRKKGKNNKSISQKVRWSSSDTSIATVNKEGVIEAKAKEGKCYVYAISHNGRTTKITVNIKNYARVSDYYNYGEIGVEVNALLEGYKEEIQSIAEYYSINRIEKGSVIEITLNDKAEVEISPQDADIGQLKEKIEKLLVDYPYYIDIEVHSDTVEFILKKEDTDECLEVYVTFWFEYNCNMWDTQIASHWDAWRFLPI